ncbi:MAG: hypothetical protein ACI83O_000825 [Patescibacteria group bacterium]|jgi:hypothetical protein
MGSNRVFAFSMFLIVLLSLSVVSASTFTTVTDLPSSVSSSTSYPVSVNFANTNNDSVTLGFIGDSTFTLLPTNGTLAGLSNANYGATLLVPAGSTSFSETLSVLVTNTSTNAVIETKTITFTATVSSQTYCEMEGFSENGTLKIDAFEINNKGDGDDDQWGLLDEIEIIVDVENRDQDDAVKNVRVEIKILDKNGVDVTNDFDFDDEEIKLGKINDDDVEVATFRIDELPVNIDQESYTIYVRAYSSSDEAAQCVSEGNDLKDYGSENSYVEIDVDNDFDEGVIVKFDSPSMLATCGSKNLELSFDVYNVGDGKEDKVLVDVRNSALDIYEQIVIDNFRDGKKKTLTYFFDVPADAEEGAYSLTVNTFFDYDDDDDSDEFDEFDYDQNSDDDMDVNYYVKLDVENCATNDNKPGVFARLVTESVVVDSPVEISVSVTNANLESGTYSISLSGVSGWSESATVTPSSLQLAGGESRDVTVSFVPVTEGVQQFAVNVNGPGVSASQDVSLSVDSVESSVASAFGDWNFSFGSGDGNYTSWLVTGLVILIIFIFLLILIVIFKRK